jgi:ABC-type multidrug transport system fused ATPase/permease subunit
MWIYCSSDLADLQSGGQKARINLARCIYSRANTIYMDDILSAVDAHTAQAIASGCLQGPLLQDRTVILVTHHVNLCLQAAQFVVSLKDGRVEQACSAAGLRVSGMPTTQLPETEKVSAPPRGSSIEDKRIDAAEGRVRKIYEDEHRAVGRVAMSHYRLLFEAAGGRWYWLIFGIIFLSARLIDILRSYVLQAWSGDINPAHLDRYLITYGVVVSGEVVLGGMRWVWLYGVGHVGFLNSGTRKIHSMLVNSLAGATLGFFERTPTGRLINIFGQDMARVDTCVSDDVGRESALSFREENQAC